MSKIVIGRSKKLSEALIYCSSAFLKNSVVYSGGWFLHVMRCTVKLQSLEMNSQRKENVVQRTCPSDIKNSYVYKSSMYVALSKCCSWGFWLLSALKTNCLLALKLSCTGFVQSGCKRAEFLFALNKPAYSESSEVASLCVLKSNTNVLICVSATIAVLFFESLHRYFLEKHMKKPNSSWG